MYGKILTKRLSFKNVLFKEKEHKHTFNHAENVNPEEEKK